MEWRPILSGAIQQRAMATAATIAGGLGETDRVLVAAYKEGAYPVPAARHLGPESNSVAAWQGPYGLTGGLVGQGVYALERRAADRLEQVVDRLTELAEWDSCGAAWFTPPAALPPHLRRTAPEGCYDVGLAHGVPGVVAFLAGVVGLGVAVLKARPLLDGAVGWVLAQRLGSEAASSFPAWAWPGPARKPARAAWCHGDPGVATALLLAARATCDSGLEREAVTIARRAAGRPPFDAGVLDATFCHGTAGLAHMFGRLYQATGDAELKAAARFWVEQTLALWRPGSLDTGLLRGDAGVALSLLAAATYVEPVWDRVLLLSTPTA